MKKILCLVLLVGFAYPQVTGNDFLKEYPFGKTDDEITKNDMETIIVVKYLSLIAGVHAGNLITMELIKRTRESSQLSGGNDDLFDLKDRTCGMPTDQLARIVKKWCDDNPSETHHDFTGIVYWALISLPLRDCE